MTYSDDSPQTKAAKASGEARRRRALERREAEERRTRAERSPGIDGHPTWCVCIPCENHRESRGTGRLLDSEARS